MWLSLEPPAALSSSVLPKGSHSLMTLLTSASLPALMPLPEAAWHSPSHWGQGQGHAWLNDVLPGAAPAEHCAWKMWQDMQLCVCRCVCPCVLLHKQTCRNIHDTAGHASWDSCPIMCGICVFLGTSAKNDCISFSPWPRWNKKCTPDYTVPLLLWMWTHVRQTQPWCLGQRMERQNSEVFIFLFQSGLWPLYKN